MLPIRTLQDIEGKLVHNASFEWLKSLGVDKVYFVGITPVGVNLDLPFDPEWDDDFVAMVYHKYITYLSLEPLVRPER